MSTAKQIAANRRNSQKSTGPNTPAGKKIVAKNAVRHGLLSTNPVISPEEQDEFHQLAAEIDYEFQPQGLREKLLISRIADLAWRLRRVSQIETGIFLLNRDREMKMKFPASPRSPEASIASAYTRNTGVFARLSRHERQIERSLQQTTDQLNRLQYARNLDIHPFFVENMRRFPDIDMSKPKGKMEGNYCSGPSSALDEKELP